MSARSTQSHKCTATTARGQPCRNWAIHHSQPPRCSSHSPTVSVGAPSGNANAETHGAYSRPEPPIELAERIKDLDRRITQLSEYIGNADIGQTEGQISLEDYIRLASLHGQLCSRLGRLMRDQQALGGTGSGAEIQAAIIKALERAGEVLGVKL